MRFSYLNFGLSVLASVIAWLLTLKIGESIRHKSWKWHLLLLAVLFALAFLALTAARKVPDYTDTSPRSLADRNVPSSAPVGATSESKPEDIFAKTYIGSSKAGKSGIKRWAVVLKEKNGPAASELTGAAVAAFTRKDFSVVPIFRSQIFQDVPYRQLYYADSALLGRLQQACDGFVIGEAERTFSTDAENQGLVTSRLTINIRIFVTESKSLKSEFQISEKGAGFSNETAEAQVNGRAAAELKERLLKEVK